MSRRIQRKGRGSQRATAIEIVQRNGMTIEDREEFILLYAIAEEAGDVPRASNTKNRDSLSYAATIWSTGVATGSKQNGWLLPHLKETKR